jgi:hypothetical protein
MGGQLGDIRWRPVFDFAPKFNLLLRNTARGSGTFAGLKSGSGALAMFSRRLDPDGPATKAKAA